MQVTDGILRIRYRGIGNGPPQFRVCQQIVANCRDGGLGLLPHIPSIKRRSSRAVIRRCATSGGRDDSSPPAFDPGAMTSCGQLALGVRVNNEEVTEPDPPLRCRISFQHDLRTAGLTADGSHANGRTTR
jgi:hypothetical protein